MVLMSALDHDFTHLLESQLAGMDGRFEEDELAFLALTSKVELPIRDRLAYELFRQLPRCRVAREWRRVNLAVLSGDHASVPLMLLEAKALYTFDLVGDASWNARYPAMVEHDIRKLRAVSNLQPETQLFALMLVNHPGGPVGSDLKQIAKYSPGMAKAVKVANGDAHTVAEQARHYLDARLKAMGPVRSGEIRAGEAYGVPLDIQFWLVGPVDHLPTTPSPGASHL